MSHRFVHVYMHCGVVYIRHVNGDDFDFIGEGLVKQPSRLTDVNVALMVILLCSRAHLEWQDHACKCCENCPNNVVRQRLVVRLHHDVSRMQIGNCVRVRQFFFSESAPLLAHRIEAVPVFLAVKPVPEGFRLQEARVGVIRVAFAEDAVVVFGQVRCEARAMGSLAVAVARGEASRSILCDEPSVSRCNFRQHLHERQRAAAMKLIIFEAHIVSGVVGQVARPTFDFNWGIQREYDVGVVGVLLHSLLDRARHFMEAQQSERTPTSRLLPHLRNGPHARVVPVEADRFGIVVDNGVLSPWVHNVVAEVEVPLVVVQHDEDALGLAGQR